MIKEKKSVRTRSFILIGLYAVLIPFSLAWYNTLIGIDCNHTKTFESVNVKIDSYTGNKQNCLEQTDFHWVKFYGINGVLYSAQLVALIMTVKKRNN
ncbi:Uncharacterised protein [uncultured archaeon]|nr:Uncharacterised protein [uncultured archaeon]